MSNTESILSNFDEEGNTMCVIQEEQKSSFVEVKIVSLVNGNFVVKLNSDVEFKKEIKKNIENGYLYVVPDKPGFKLVNWGSTGNGKIYVVFGLPVPITCCYSTFAKCEVLIGNYGGIVLIKQGTGWFNKTVSVKRHY